MSIPQIYEPDPNEIIRDNSRAIEQQVNRTRYEGTMKHDPWEGSRPWYFDDEPTADEPDPNLTPYQ